MKHKRKSIPVVKSPKLRRLVPVAIAAAVGALPAAAVAKPKGSSPPPPPPTAHIALDSYHAWSRHYTPPVSTPFKVARHSYYVATVDGSLSYYAAVNYQHPKRPWKIVCGTPDSGAKYPGAGGDGPVGFDAEFVFARPWRAKRCQRANLPARWRNFQMDDGSGWQHPVVLGAPPAVPRSDHTYSYAVVGHNEKVRFRLLDRLTRDNYGLLKITVRPATVADCGSFASFGFVDQTSCMAGIVAP